MVFTSAIVAVNGLSLLSLVVTLWMVSYSVLYRLNEAMRVTTLFGQGRTEKIGRKLDTLDPKSEPELSVHSIERCVCRGNSNFRLKTSVPAEYIMLMLLTALAIIVLNINANGGVMNQFNHLMATPTAVAEIYNQWGSTHLIVVHIKGVRSGDRIAKLSLLTRGDARGEQASPLRVDGDFTIIKAKGQDFIVQSAGGQIYKVGHDSTAQIIPEYMTADVKAPAITYLEPLTIDDDRIQLALEKFKRAGSTVFLSGKLTIDDSEGIHYTPDPDQFPFIKVSRTSLTLETAPLSTVLNYFYDQYVTGQLQLRIINEAIP